MLAPVSYFYRIRLVSITCEENNVWANIQAWWSLTASLIKNLSSLIIVLCGLPDAGFHPALSSFFAKNNWVCICLLLFKHSMSTTEWAQNLIVFSYVLLRPFFPFASSVMQLGMNYRTTVGDLSFLSFFWCNAQYSHMKGASVASAAACSAVKYPVQFCGWPWWNQLLQTLQWTIWDPGTCFKQMQ